MFWRVFTCIQYFFIPCVIVLGTVQQIFKAIIIIQCRARQLDIPYSRGFPIICVILHASTIWKYGHTHVFKHLHCRKICCSLTSYLLCLRAPLGNSTNSSNSGSFMIRSEYDTKILLTEHRHTISHPIITIHQPACSNCKSMKDRDRSFQAELSSKPYRIIHTFKLEVSQVVSRQSIKKCLAICN